MPQPMRVTRKTPPGDGGAGIRQGGPAALHRGDGITLTLQANALTHDGPKLAVGDISSTTAVHSLQVAAKHEDLVRLQRCDEFRCYSLVHK